MEQSSEVYIKGYIDRARKAQAQFERYTQEQVDAVVRAAGKAIYDHAEMLAQMAVEETGMGVYEDKVAKNRHKPRMVWNHLKDKKSVGIIERDVETGIVKVAKPKGVVAAITPVTNPIVTPATNSMAALKGRNAIVITPHHKAFRCSTRAVELIKTALAKLDAPEHLVQILDQQSRENTKNLIAAADTVIATGGMGMVKAAYSSGKPALGVGAGNVQCIVDDDADLADAVPRIISGRINDNGILCSAEQSIIASEKIYSRLLDALKANGAYVVAGGPEREALRKAIFEEGKLNRHAVGQSVQDIARLAGISVPESTRVIAIEAEGRGEADLLAKEKMCPVLALFKTRDFQDSVETARANLDAEGKGHSVSIHSNTTANIEYAGEQLSVSRFLINQSCSAGAGGSFYNGLAPTNTLGCGSWGNNSISENLDYIHLINISRIAYHMPDNPVPTDEEIWAE